MKVVEHLRSPDFRRRTCLTVIVLTGLAYFFVYANTPFSLEPAAGHDDGFSIHRTTDLLKGNWLGPYNQYTLMKGCGLALFEALLGLFRIPVNLGQAVLNIGSSLLLGYAGYRLTGSMLFGLLSYELMLWNFGVDDFRPMREALYCPLFLIVFSLLCLALFRSGGKRAAVLAGLAGTALGWFWITREESVVVVPALLLLFACAYAKQYGARLSSRPLLLQTGVFLFASFLFPLSVSLANWHYYGTFTVVDIKGAFQNALERLQSIQPGTPSLPYVPVPQAAREKAYNVSPSFARLKAWLDGPLGDGWKAAGCHLYAQSCGDFAGGWFMWALRDAAAASDAYRDAPTALQYFQNVANEIARACNDGRLTCSHQFLPFLPQIDGSEISRIPGAVSDSLSKLSFRQPPRTAPPASLGPDDVVRSAASLLNVTNYIGPPEPVAWLSNPAISHYALTRRAACIRFYRKILRPLLILGALAFAAAWTFAILRRSYSVELAIASVALVAVGTRVAALVLIDISSFPGITHPYLNYAFQLSCFAALLSIYICARDIRDWRAHSIQTAETEPEG